MKSKLVFEIETPDYLEVFPEEGQSKEDFKGKESELEEFRIDFAKQLHKSITEELGTYFSKKDVSCSFEEWWLENAEELSVDGYDFEDYRIKITVKKENAVLGEEEKRRGVKHD